MKIVVENGTLVEVKVDYEKDCLTEFAIPDGVIKLENESLAYLPMDIETLYIPKSVEEICNGALFGEAGDWENLKNIIVEEGNPNYKSQDGCLIDIKNNTVLLGTANAVIPEGVEKIGFFAFRQRQDLTEVTIPASVKQVDMQAFACCPNLKKVTILSKDTNIDQLCFISSLNISEFNLPKDCDYEFNQGCLIKKSCNTLLLLTNDGEIPSTIKALETGSVVRYYKDVYIPDTIEEMGGFLFVIGGGKFKVKKDSVAHKYAIENNISYEEI